MFLIVGEAPAKDLSKKNLDVSLACRSIGRRPVTGILTLLRDEHERLFDFVMHCRHVNLLDYWPGPGHGKGSAFPMDEARLKARELVEAIRIPVPRTRLQTVRSFHVWNGVKFYKPKVVLLCGHRVASAFMIHRAKYFVTDLECRRVAGLPTVVVPHPSGLNRWWNEPQNREQGKMFLDGLGQMCGSLF
jgi:hypothetical protein